ncbi:tautomerase family protein [Staphylococcus aureus]|uniref:tautomerase family protein n=1 Tax=Staphylococcus aureus TaxID=1280 RepID=UPI0039BE6D1A
MTKEQKEKIIKGVTDLLFDVLGKPHSSTSVIISEVDPDNWGVGGETVTKRRAAQKS